MVDGQPLFLVIKLWLVLVPVIISAVSNSKLVAAHDEQAKRKLEADTPPGFISIDCGATEGHRDTETGLFYETDAGYVDTGEVHEISSQSIYNSYEQKLRDLRSFPIGTRNCYTLKPEQGTNNNYLIRAIFVYGNYDNKNQLPVFDLYIGVNKWATVNIDNSFCEIINVFSDEYIDVCLVNTGTGVPYISVLELRPLNNSIYLLKDGALRLLNRYDVGAGINDFTRYPEDVYDRLWYPTELNDSDFNRLIPISTESNINTESFGDAYQVPDRVLRTAFRTQNASIPIILPFIPSDPDSPCYIYFHFAEIVKLKDGQKRKLSIDLNSTNTGLKVIGPPITLEYLRPMTLTSTDLPPISCTGLQFSIYATGGPDLPPILNAIEFFMFVGLPLSPTNLNDVKAIKDIKRIYNITRNWQGDPCLPSNFSWEGLNCKNDSTPRIISLNLSSSELTGKQIATSVSNLELIMFLDLSYNNLTGPLPEFLAQLPNLKMLNLTGNKFTGSVPDALLEKSKNGKLILRLEEIPRQEEIPGACQSESCHENKKKFIIPVIACTTMVVLLILFSFIILAIYKRHRKREEKWRLSLIIAVGVALLIPLLCYLCYLIWRKLKAEVQRIMNKRKLLRELGDNVSSPNTGGLGKTQEKDQYMNRELKIFNFQTIVSATNNFSSENKLGEGGFGPVYKGKLLDGQEIAIKRLSRRSGQGIVEFKNESKLIAKLQHTNLVRLLGCSLKGEERILVYEYMHNKSLDFFIFDSDRKKLLDWKKRFNIIEGIAQGLIYLHKYSRLRVIHRDLKASNILLDDQLNPKISDFGMAKIFGANESEASTNRVVGTYGYMSPEYAMSGIVSMKTDIFSFGVLVLEVVSGKKNNSCYHTERPLNLVGYAWQLWNEGKGLELIDTTLDQSCCPNDQVLRCLHVGLLCVQDQATDRPTISDVVSMLSNQTMLLPTPKQPAFFINVNSDEEQEASEIKLENCSTNDVTISEMEAR